MWNMQLCMAHLLVVSDVWYLQNSASGGAKTLRSDQKWLYFQRRLLSFEDIEHWRPPKDAPCKAAYFTYQALNFLINIGGLNWANCLAKTGTELAGSGFSWNLYSRNGPKIELLLTLSTMEMILIWEICRKELCMVDNISVVWYSENRWININLSTIAKP